MSGFAVEARRFVVRGRVQGVGFRAFAARTASGLRLTGGATNLPGGGVRVAASGPAHALDRLEAALWEGPRLARVDSVETAVVASIEGEGPFDIDF